MASLRAQDRVTMDEPDSTAARPDAGASRQVGGGRTPLSQNNGATPAPPPVSLLADTHLVERYWLPAHDVRRKSPLFVANKKLLRDDMALPCWICRQRGGPKNPLEVHHIFEWALWNALDPDRVTRILEVLEFYEDGYLAAAGSMRRALEAVLATAKRTGSLSTPDDVRNLVVLCQAHHRSRFTGAHMITFPIWLALSALRSKAGLDRAAVVRVATNLKRIDEAVSDIVGPEIG